MAWFRNITRAGLCLLSLLQLACGGGGGSGRDEPPVAAQPFAVTETWSLASAAQPLTLISDSQGRGFLYSVQKSAGLVVFKTAANTTAPTQIAQVTTDRLALLDAIHLTQQGNILYLAMGDLFRDNSPAGVATIDVTNPEVPVVVGNWPAPIGSHGASDIVLYGDRAYLATMRSGVQVLDISDSANVSLVTTVLPDIDYPVPNPNSVQFPNARGTVATANRLYIANDAGGLHIYEHDGMTYTPIGRYINSRMAGKQSAYNNLWVQGNTVFAAVDYCGLEIIDITDERNPTQIGWWNPWQCDTNANNWLGSDGHTNQLEYDPARQLIYLSAGDSELLVVDVSDLENPTLKASLGEPKNSQGAWGIARQGDMLYLSYLRTLIPFVSNWSGIKGFQISPP